MFLRRHKSRLGGGIESEGVRGGRPGPDHLGRASVTARGDNLIPTDHASRAGLSSVRDLDVACRESVWRLALRTTGKGGNGMLDAVIGASSRSRAPSEGERDRAALARHRSGDFISFDDGNGGRSEHVGRGR